jgi:cell division protein FtsI (penicillin-binding protein 3)
VVLFGTGKEAQLNGYSSAGKTGTAQKIDPRTHTYSKTLHIASFAGFAPVNNPVIAVAIIIDSPQGAYYGASISAPVFAEVAQQVLEYLGVHHDIDVRPASTKPEPPITEDDSADQDNVQALYAAANELPSDDPESAAPNPPAPASAPAAQPTPQSQNPAAHSSAAPVAPAPAPAPPQAPSPPPRTVTLSEDKQLRVPSLIGLPVRSVIEQAGIAGLEVQIVGNGTAREQAPAPGSMVPPGTKIVVRCAR